MNLEEGLKVIRRELKQQAENHQNSALKRVSAYEKNGDLNSLVEGARLDVIADALQGLGKALTIEKVRCWQRQAGDSHG